MNDCIPEHIEVDIQAAYQGSRTEPALNLYKARRNDGTTKSIVNIPDILFHMYVTYVGIMLIFVHVIECALAG